jgi:hypothetical protein
MNVRERARRDAFDLLRAANPVSPARRFQLAAEGDTPTVNEILARARTAPAGAQTPAHRSTSTRRIAVIVGLAGLLAFAGIALGIGLSDYLSQQETIDKQAWTPPDMKAAGARVEVARGVDWSFMAWKSTKGICVAYAAGSADGWARACGFLPGSPAAGPDASKYLGVLLTSPSDDGVSDGLGAIVGAVGPAVDRVDLQLSDGRVISARTEAPPPALEAEVRLFLVRTRLVVSGGTPPGPRVNSVTSYARDGTRLERFSTSLG